MRNGTTLTLHITLNHKLYTISFQMAYNVAVCTVGILNSSDNAFFFSLAAQLPGFKVVNSKLINVCFNSSVQRLMVKSTLSQTSPGTPSLASSFTVFFVSDHLSEHPSSTSAPLSAYFQK